MHSFSTPWKDQKTEGFLMFSRVREGALGTKGLIMDLSETYSEPSQTSKKQLFAKIVNG